jgi:hypothetical protein
MSYFSPTAGIVSVLAGGNTGIAAAITGARTKGLSPSQQDSFVLGSLAPFKLFGKQNIAASQTAATVQDLFVLPSRLKIPKINVAFTAISSLAGDCSFNIVVGLGAYETTGAAATATVTLSGAPLTTATNTYTINGVVIVAPQLTANSLTQQAAADVLLINAQSGRTGVFATSAVAVITLVAAPGLAGNAITLTAVGSAGGDVATASAAALSGGTATAGIVTPGNDKSSSSGFCTNPAVAGNALFNIDVPINLTTFPGATLAGGGSAGLGLVPTFWDAVFACGSILTLRLITPAGGSITNFTTSADAFIQPLEPTFPSQVVSPAPAIPVPGLDF